MHCIEYPGDGRAPPSCLRRHCRWLLLLFCLLLTGCQARQTIQAQAGELDLRQYPFEASGPLTLTGAWRIVHYGSMPGQRLHPAHDQYLTLPSTWGKQMAPYSRIALQLEVLLPETPREYTLHVSQGGSAYRLLANEQELIRVGELSERGIPGRPGLAPTTLRATLSGRVVLTWDVEETHRGMMGLDWPIILGEGRQVGLRHHQQLFKATVIVMGLLLVGLFYTTFFLLRRQERTALIGAMLCLVLATRHSLTQLLWPALTERDLFEVTIIGRLATYYLAITLFAWFLEALFPHRWLRRWCQISSIFTGIGLVSLAILPRESASLGSRLFDVCLLTGAIICTLRVIAAALSRAPLSRVTMLGLLLVVLSALHDAAADWGLPNLGVGTIEYVMLFFVCLQGIDVAASFARARQVAEQQSMQLALLLQRQSLLKLEVEKSNRELAQTQVDLRQALDSALSLAEARSRFLANMSHEIRTPMNGVLGMTELLLDTPLTPHQRDFAETIHRSGRGLLTVINDILDFSRVEAGRMSLETGPYSPATVVEDVVALLAAEAERKRLELVSIISPDVPGVLLGDPVRLQQVFTNLVGNALKFTETGSVVIRLEVEARQDGHARMRVSVQDTGIGIPPEALPGLFQAFSQADSSTTRRYGGTGLGLAISRQLIRLMGGEIQVNSQEGVGSTFTATFRQKMVHDEEARPLELAAPNGTDLELAHTPRVLLVSVRPVVLESLQCQLSGTEHVAAASAEAASRLLAPGLMPGLEVLVLDHHPDLDLPAVLQHWIARGPLSRRPVVLISHQGLERDEVGEMLPEAMVLHRPLRGDALRAAVGFSMCTAPVPLTLRVLASRDPRAACQALLASPLEKLSPRGTSLEQAAPDRVASNQIALEQVALEQAAPEPAATDPAALSKDGLNRPPHRSQAASETASTDDTGLTSLAPSSSSPRTTMEPPPTAPPRKLLLAEDNLVNQRVALRLLEKLGFEVTLAENGRAALELVQKDRFLAILMDCQMPELDGYEATRRIRQLGGIESQIPIIALTAHALPEERERALEAGMNDYVIKPVDKATLAAALSRWIQAESGSEAA